MNTPALLTPAACDGLNYSLITIRHKKLWQKSSEVQVQQRPSFGDFQQKRRLLIKNKFTYYWVSSKMQELRLDGAIKLRIVISGS